MYILTQINILCLKYNMQSIADITQKIVSQNQFISEYMAMGIINTSQYARKIQAEVEQISYKKVELATIVTSLNRIKKNMQKVSKINFYIDNIQMKYPISDIVFTKFDNDFKYILEIYNLVGHKDNSFLNITQGQSETNIFANSTYIPEITASFKTHKPLYTKHNLAGITIKFSPKYMDLPGSAFSVLRTISLEGINLIEVVSTFTEMTFFVDLSDSQKVMELFKRNFLRK